MSAKTDILFLENESKLKEKDGCVKKSTVVRFIRDHIPLGTFMHRGMNKADEACWDLCNRITDDLEPELRWIPCSERPPRTSGNYNVTRKISDGFECRNISDTCYFDGSNTWHDDTRVNHGRRYLTDVIAWRHLPEPYKGEEE